MKHARSSPSIVDCSSPALQGKSYFPIASLLPDLPLPIALAAYSDRFPAAKQRNFLRCVCFWLADLVRAERDSSPLTWEKVLLRLQAAMLAYAADPGGTGGGKKAKDHTPCSSKSTASQGQPPSPWRRCGWQLPVKNFSGHPTTMQEVGFWLESKSRCTRSGPYFMSGPITLAWRSPPWFRQGQTSQATGYVERAVPHPHVDAYRLDPIATCVDRILRCVGGADASDVELNQLTRKLSAQELNPEQLREYLLYLGNGLLNSEDRCQWFCNHEAAFLHKALVSLQATNGRVEGYVSPGRILRGGTSLAHAVGSGAASVRNTAALPSDVHLHFQGFRGVVKQVVCKDEARDADLCAPHAESGSRGGMDRARVERNVAAWPRSLTLPRGLCGVSVRHPYRIGIQPFAFQLHWGSGRILQMGSAGPGA